MHSSVDDYSLKSQLSSYGEKHNIAAGFDIIHHSFTPNELDVSSGSLIADFVEFNKNKVLAIDNLTTPLKDLL